MLTDDELRELLQEGESARLDYKRDQYAPPSADKSDRAEFLKDLLAMANAHRAQDSFILIGVDERADGGGEVVGVDEHFDDAHLQQFVTSKLQRALRFGYARREVDGRSIGILHIPMQEPPFYLVKPYGGLLADVVYIRRGSSTGTATPDEIYAMGRRAASVAARARVEVEFVEPSVGAVLGHEISITSVIWEPVPEGSLPSVNRIDSILDVPLRNSAYYREMQRYVLYNDSYREVALQAFNRTSVLATDVRLHLETPNVDGLGFAAPFRRPSFPKIELMSTAALYAAAAAAPAGDPSVSIDGRAGLYRIALSFGKVQPNTSSDPIRILVAASHPEPVLLQGTITGDNFDPVQVSLVINPSQEHRKATPQLLMDRAQEIRAGLKDGVY
jgi:hypothetical protein